MSTDSLNPNVTTTTTQTKTETAPPQPVTVTSEDKENMVTLKLFLEMMKSYGLPTAFCVYFIFGWMEPMKVGHLDFLEKTGNAVTTQAETIKTFGATNEKISSGIVKVGDAVEAAAEVANEANTTNRLMLDRVKEHYDISKQTHEDVKAIRSIVDGPIPSGTKKKP
jgi:hypothetical protein